MFLTLLTLAALIILAGVEYTFLIIVVALLVYMYPIQAVLGLTAIGLLKWHGDLLKIKANEWFRKQRQKRLK